MQKLERTPFKTSRVAEYFDAHELEYVERKLEDKGVRDKLIPPDEALRGGSGASLRRPASSLKSGAARSFGSARTTASTTLKR